MRIDLDDIMNLSEIDLLDQHNFRPLYLRAERNISIPGWQPYRLRRLDKSTPHLLRLLV
jgi:hypothetical protein